MAYTNIDRKKRAIPPFEDSSPTTMRMQREIEKISEHTIVLAQHFKHLKEDLQNKINELVDSTKDSDAHNHTMFGAVKQELNGKSSDEYTLIAKAIVENDSLESREKLLDEVANIVASGTNKPKSNSFNYLSLIHLMVTAVLAVSVIIMAIRH